MAGEPQYAGMAMELLAFFAPLGIGFVRVLLLGLIFIWALRNLSVTREPAFAGFCVALGLAFTMPRGVDLDDYWQSALGWALGTIGGLVLLWRWKVRPERAGQFND